MDTGRGTEKNLVLVTWTWKAGAVGAVCECPGTHWQGEKSRPAMKPGRGCGGVESMGIWVLEAVQKARKGELQEKCGKIGRIRMGGREGGK